MKLGFIFHPFIFRLGAEIDCECEHHIHIVFSLTLVSLDFAFNRLNSGS